MGWCGLRLLCSVVLGVLLASAGASRAQSRQGPPEPGLRLALRGYLAYTTGSGLGRLELPEALGIPGSLETQADSEGVSGLAIAELRVAGRVALDTVNYVSALEISGTPFFEDESAGLYVSYHALTWDRLRLRPFSAFDLQPVLGASVVDVGEETHGRVGAGIRVGTGFGDRIPLRVRHDTVFGEDLLLNGEAVLDAGRLLGVPGMELRTIYGLSYPWGADRWGGWVQPIFQIAHFRFWQGRLELAPLFLSYRWDRVLLDDIRGIDIGPGRRGASLGQSTGPTSLRGLVEADGFHVGSSLVVRFHLF